MLQTQVTEKTPAPKPADKDRRRHKRIDTAIEGRIVYPGVDAECIIHEMSATGAVVEVVPLPALGTEIALDVPGVGFTRGRTVRYLRDKIGLELHTHPSKQHKFVDRLILVALENKEIGDE
mgnify:CR=1 FL=1